MRNIPAIDCYGATRQGDARDHNTDQFLISNLNYSMLVLQTSLPTDDYTRIIGESQGCLLVVADGLGDQAKAGTASHIVIEAVVQYVLNLVPWLLHAPLASEDDLLHGFKQALKKSQPIIKDFAEIATEERPIATTITLAYIVWPRLFVVDVGSSCCFLQRDGLLHSIGRKPEGLGPENTVGGEIAAIEANLAIEQLKPSDVLLLGTDGLTEHVDQLLISELLACSTSAQNTASELLVRAVENGSDDDVTAIVVRFQDSDNSPIQPSLAVSATGDVSHDKPSKASAQSAEKSGQSKQEAAPVASS